MFWFSSCELFFHFKKILRNVFVNFEQKCVTCLDSIISFYFGVQISPFYIFLFLILCKKVDPTFHSIVSNGSFLLVSTENGVEANMALGVPRQEAEKMTNDDKGRILLPKRMNFWKSAKGGGGGVIFNPKIYIAYFGNFKQGFLSMKLIKRRVISGFRVCFKLSRTAQ